MANKTVIKALGANPEGEKGLTFWDLFKQSVILQAIMALAMLGAIIYLVCVGRPVPEILAWGFSLILGFYFGTKTSQAAAGPPPGAG